MRVQDHYRWEAETEDGAILTAENYKSGDLTPCVRISLIPNDDLLLPTHVIAGVKMKRRFCRGFIAHQFNNTPMLPGFQNWENGSRIIVTESDLRDLIKPGTKIKKRHSGEQWWEVLAVTEKTVILREPYDGRTKRIESRILLPSPPEEYVHCIVCEGYRVYVRSSDGSAIITPEDYELYL